MCEEIGSLSAQVLNLEEQRNTWKKKCGDLENIIKKKMETIGKLRIDLQKERLKNGVICEVLKQMTGVKLTQFYEEKEDGVHITNIQGGSLPIFVHDFLGEAKQYTIQSKTKTTQPGKNFRTVKNKVDLVEENPQEQEEKIRQVEEKNTELARENFDVPYKETIELIDGYFEKIENGRTYEKSLESIKETRIKLLGKLDLNEYIKLIKSHVARLNDIFIKKKFDSKKAVATVSKCLSSLDQRFIYYPQYYNTEIDVDNLQRFKNAMNYHMDYPKRYVPFSYSELYENICNYGLCFVHLREILKRVLVNPYNFPNVIYLGLEKSTDEDPYSFYVLEKIEPDGKRHWKMECRLDEFSKTLGEQIKNYCITLFRKIYFDIFNDNIFREEYIEKAPAAKFDCEQLLINVILLSRTRKFCDLLRKIVFKNSKINPTPIDKFNLTKDDPLVRKNFAEDEDNIDSYVILKRIFDNITDEQCKNIWLERTES